MKSLLLLVSSLLFVCIGQSQPGLQVPYDLVPGYGYTYKEITNAANYVGIPHTGTNLTWDFTAIQLSGTVRTDTILTLQESLFPASFPTASYVLQEPNGLQQFYEIKQDTVYYLGNSYNNQPSVFSPGLPVFSLPLAYQTVVTDKFSQNTAPGYSAQWKGSFRYEAYGTLNLPNGVSYTNVGLYVGVTGEANGSTAYLNYSFFRAQDRIPLLRVQLQQVGTALTVQSAFLTETFPAIGIEEDSKLNNRIAVFPNPAHTQVQITGLHATSSTLSVLNATGAKLHEQQVDGQSSTLDVSAFPKGLYFIQVKSQAGVLRKRLLIQ